MTLLTDRSLYRPGQTVYVKGIAFAQKSDTADVIPNKAYTVTLYDANYQEVGRKDVYKRQREEGYVRFTGNCFGKQCLTCSRRAY